MNPPGANARIQAVEIAQRSDPGRDPDKQINEDVAAHAETRFGHLCFVCDGMGGHEGGREAAETATATILDFVSSSPDGAPPREVLRGAIAEANRRVWGMSDGDVNAARAGSTCVAVLLHNAGTEVAHLGDSRCYHLHQNDITQITRDHSMVQELVDAGVLTREQAAVHPDANMITRALGMAAEADVEARPEPVPHVAGDAFVLCSDGLSDLVSPHEIQSIVGSSPPAQAAGQLVDLANARGGHDNITVVILRARESAVVAPQTNVLPPTVVQTIPDHSTPDVAPIASPPPPPPSPRQEKQGMSLAVVGGVGIALVGVASLSIALYVVMKERHHVAAAVPLSLAVDAAAPSSSVTLLAAPSASSPATAATEVDASTAPPIAPLVPGWRRSRHRDR